MKKFMTFAAIIAATMVSFSACEKTPATGGNDDQACADCGKNPCECVEYVSPITVDGQFDDWTALGSKAVVAVRPENAPKEGLKEMRAYADAEYLNVYVEFDFDVVTDREAPSDEHGGNPFTLWFSSNKDNGGYDVWSDLCVEYHCAAYIFTGTDGVYSSWDDALYGWTGEVHASGWTWDTQALESLSAVGAGSSNKYEISIPMEVLSGVMEFDGKLYLGAMVQQGWGNGGALPCASMDPDTNPTGAAPMMEVPIN